MANYFQALEDSGSDGEGGANGRASQKAAEKFNEIFSSATVKVNASITKEVAALSKSNFQVSSLGSMNSVLDSLTESAPAQVLLEKKPKEHKASWNFEDLANVNRVVDETDKRTSKTRFNPLLNATVEQHEKDVNGLMSAIQSSKFVKEKRSKNTCTRSRKANRRKAKMLQRGQAFADRQEFKAGRTKTKSRAWKKFGKSRHSPY